MEKKIVIIIEILIVVGLFIFYIVTEAIPDYKKSVGSSDKFINAELYNKMYEINIDNNINFSIIIDENNNIYHMFFFNKVSAVLANKNIENNKLEEGLNKIYTILFENDYINTSSNIIITKYDSKNDIIYDLVNNLNKKYNLNCVVSVKESTLADKVKELRLDIDLEDNNSILKDIDLYSKEYIRLVKNVVLTQTESYNYKQYSDNVYSKITNFMNLNDISNLNVNDTTLVINMIPADEEFKIYPSINSWYYVKEKKVYAYIEFIVDDNNTKGYCYYGDINNVEEGVCKNEEIWG